MGFSPRTRSSGAATLFAFGLALCAGPAPAAIMTFENIGSRYVWGQPYSEDGITLNVIDDQGSFVFQSRKGIPLNDYYGPTELEFSMAGPFSAKSLFLLAGHSYQTCYIGADWPFLAYSACSSAPLPGGVALSVAGARADGSSVQRGVEHFEGTLELSPEFSDLIRLTVQLNVRQRNIPTIAYLDPTKPDGSGGYVVEQGFYTVFNCSKICVSAMVDNLVLLPQVPVAPVPLPTSGMLAAFGLGALALPGWRRRRAA